MNKGRIIIPLLFGVVFGYLTQSCANVVRPSGGERDQVGPKVETFLPTNGSLNFADRQVVVKFDEYLKEGSYGDQVFISPVPPIAPEVIVRNKELIIRFRAPLMENTTYVISIGKGILDYNEGNEMPSALTYAFSTGEALDSMYFRGTVQDGWLGAPPQKLKLLLFIADSVPDNDFRGKSPLYVAEADGQSGAFNFLYLKNQRYKVFGVMDNDNSFSYNSDNEPIALIADPLVDVGDSSLAKKTILLESFLPDNTGPEIRSAKCLNRKSIHVELREKVRQEFGGDSLRIILSDTFGNGSREIKGRYFVFQSETDLLLDANLTDSVPQLLKFENLFDSLGNRGDTTLLLLPQTKSDFGGKYKFLAPKFDLEHQMVYLESTLPFDKFEGWEEYFQIIDTGKSALPLKANFESPFNMTFTFDSILPNPKIPYNVQIIKGFPLRDSILKDSLPALKVNFPSEEEFGSIIGKVVPDSTDPADMQYIVCLLQPGSRGGFSIIRRTKGEQDFHFDWLSPGKYRILVIKDADRNGYWTPGSVMPYRMPEQVYRDPEVLEIKANWDLEGYTVKPVKSQPGKNTGTRMGTK